jgi:hypothetical protein
VSRTFGILLATMLTNPVVAIAQSCEALPVDNSPLSYRFRANNIPRCEGMYRYRSPVSGDRVMALVSLTFGKVNYDTRRDQYLVIKLPIDSAEKTLVRAVGVPERLSYRLDVELEPGRREFRLPLVDLVAPQKILPEAFGIYAARKLPECQKRVPSRLRTELQCSSARGGRRDRSSGCRRVRRWREGSQRWTTNGTSTRCPVSAPPPNSGMPGSLDEPSFGSKGRARGGERSASPDSAER